MAQIDVLINNSAYLVHCISQNGGAGNAFVQGKGIYERFKICISEKPEISCSTIQVGDTIIYRGRTNFFAPCGIIVKPGIITYATHKDSGTGVEIYGSRSTEFGETSVATDVEISNAICNRNINSYNELAVKDYTVVGLFLNMDDIQYLYANIVNESVFYENTKRFNIDYFFIEKGVIYRANFDNEKSYFTGNGRIGSNQIYI
jgi:hypothetical protein